MGRMKTVLFYGMFWLLGVIASSLTGLILFGGAVFIRLSKFGAGDPEIIAGVVFESTVSWLLALVFISIFAYPLFAFCRKKFKFPSLVVFVGTAILMIVIWVSSGEELGFWYLIKIVNLGVFIIVSLTIPFRMGLRKLEHQEYKKIIENFD